MKRLIFVIPFLFFIFLSCSDSKPEGVLSEREMSELMTEVYAVDGYLNMMPIDSSRKLLPVLYQHIFDRFDIDSSQFNVNVDYYYGNPVELEKLLTEVQKNLGELEREAMKGDSIYQAHFRDSVAVAQRWMRLKQEAEDRIRHVYIDTTATYDAGRYSTDFFAALELYFTQNRPMKPAPTVTPPVDDLPEEGQQEGDLNEEALEVQPVENRGSRVLDRPRPVGELQQE